MCIYHRPDTLEMHKMERMHVKYIFRGMKGNKTAARKTTARRCKKSKENKNKKQNKKSILRANSNSSISIQANDNR